MAWSTPKTWTFKWVPTFAEFNAEIRDRFNLLKTSITDAGFLKLARDQVTTEQEVVNTTTETSVYSKVVAGGTIGSTRIVELALKMTYLNNSGGADTFTPRVKFGGTTIATSAPSLGAGANRRTMTLLITIIANGATNSQRTEVRWICGAGAAAGAFDGAVSFTTEAYHELAIDSTADQTLTVTVQHGTAAATISLKRTAASLIVKEAA